ncbi:hypothetical protein P280DRAFT_548773 [Massarina eburnea CBS 473.64]|uniref:Uncharacterized protein n=1 Tax=Massarina eburnea CBS 473.64 TaxID=1395130 RepID=A0A6A6S2X1_9PLEO|nr:hypothetical protein P280DRAFT_548773 [Massarina eburnea CBS 473.64]
MNARYLSGQAIQTVTKGAKTIMVEYVEKTTAWTRPAGYPADNVKQEFVSLVDDYFDKLQPTTAKVAMKESEHPSDNDKRKHYTAFELDKDNKHVNTIHLHRKE